VPWRFWEANVWSDLQRTDVAREAVDHSTDGNILPPRKRCGKYAPEKVFVELSGCEPCSSVECQILNRSRQRVCHHNDGIAACEIEKANGSRLLVRANPDGEPKAEGDAERVLNECPYEDEDAKWGPAKVPHISQDYPFMLDQAHGTGESSPTSQPAPSRSPFHLVGDII
jgi:hypothetical protein